MTPLLMLLTAAVPQVATTSTAPTVQAAPANRKVCRSTKLVGSQIPKRICHTAAEWHAIDDADDVNRSRVMEGRRFSGQ